MKLENQVVSLELAKKLKELGVKQDSLLCWSKINEMVWLSDDFKNSRYYSLEAFISAFTVAELGEILKRNGCKSFQSFDVDGMWCCWHRSTNFIADTEADARAKMLIYLLENKLITL